MATLTGAADKLAALSAIHAGKDKLPRVYPGTAEWDMWRSWRKRHGLGTAFMDSREWWGVPTMTPPVDIDHELQQGRTGKARVG